MPDACIQRLGVILKRHSFLRWSSAASGVGMFTLCMSRQGSTPDVQPSSPAIKEVHHGYLLRYKKGLILKKWSEDWFVLYENSLLVWYADKNLHRPKGRILINDAPELLAVGEWTVQVPKKPAFPRGCHIGQLIAIGSKESPHVCWLIAQSTAEATDWMTAISNTLPPPPSLFIQKKRLKLTSSPANNIVSPPSCPTNGTVHAISTPSSSQVRRHHQANNYDADHTVLSGVAIDWGHGWGWGQSVFAAHTACAADAAFSSALFCPPAVADYGVSTGLEECDWSSFGDFAF